MRPLFSLLLLPLLFGPALADDTPKPVTHHPRVTWQAHFAQANLAHDGHLTLAEAQDGYKLIARHFDDIDVDHKGYVTEDNVRVWQAIRKAARRLAHPVSDRLKPRHAFQVHNLTPPAPPIQTASVPGRIHLAPRSTRVSK